MHKRGLVTCEVVCILLALTFGKKVNHGGIKMGVSDNRCDNAKWNIRLDWDDRTNRSYTCHHGEDEMHVKQLKPIEICLKEKDIPDPIHTCMSKAIYYADDPPTAGPHRPLWPVYGEYLYLPPQRWIHSLEHGAAVFLYHPCVDKMEVVKFKNIARSCLYRHIITPYRNLTSERPFAILTYGCKLLLSNVDVNRAETFIKKYALKAPEHVSDDGQYDHGLVEKAKLVTDERDSLELCPPPIDDILNK